MEKRERLQLATGWAEWERGDLVEVGDRAIPRVMDVTFPSTGDRWPSLAMRIEARSGAPECVELTIRADADGREVRSQDLRSVRLEEWIEDIVGEAALSIVEGEDGETYYTRVRTIGGTSREEEDTFRASRKVVRQARSRRKMTDDLLESVAQVYRDHATDRPTEAVRMAFGTSARTAARYVQQARQKGLLPPTSQGKVSV